MLGVKLAMKRTILAILLSMACVVSLRAEIFQIGLLDGKLDGTQETPPNGSTATAGEVGNGITYDNSTMTLNVNVAYGLFGFSPLTGDFTATHIHQGVVGQPGPVVIPLTATANDTHSGLIQNSVVLTPALETALFADDLYLNIHSTLFPNGEIRAQLIPTSVPEPTTWAIVGTGLAGLLMLRRRAS
jgi:hypothetical protein